MSLIPPTIIYGTEMPEIRLRMQGGEQIVFCLNNGSLRLSDDALRSGTYETGDFLGALCEEHCAPLRVGYDPCPALVDSHEEDGGLDLSTVVLHRTPKWELCPGVRRAIEANQTEEERWFFTNYLDIRWAREAHWRGQVIEAWNEGWENIIDYLPPYGVRAGKIDRLIWRTARFAALIPQPWLNWFYGAPECLQEDLAHGQPSRVDFIAFASGRRHVVEIDGPSHYSKWSQKARCYVADEAEYARNLRIERWLASEGWHLTRIGRQEVREAMHGGRGLMTLMQAMPFGREMTPEPTMEELGVPELEDGFIPF